jgi:endonuclease/exonuclease/phosphatase family metal-dependent hydrolase
MKVFIRKIGIPFTIVYVVFFVVYVFACASLFIPPEVFLLSGFGAFILPILFAANIFFIPILFFFGSALRWLSIAGLLPGLIIIPLIYQLGPSDNQINEQDIKILSFNSGGYMYNSKKRRTVEVETWILKQKFDIVCLQEYFPEWRAVYLKQPDGESKKHHVSVSLFGEKFPYNYIGKKDNMLGVATFSKHPIINSGVIFWGQKKHNKGVYTDIKIGKDTLRVVNVHLESNLQPWSNIKSKNIVVALKVFVRNQQTRSIQAELVAQFVENSNLPTIVTGDFNETQFSYAYFRLRGLLKNTFEEKGKGLGATFRPKTVYLRIDHQFYSPDLQLESFEVLPDLELSDHAPLISRYSVRR